jgi:outer membrane receptor protein involved in Fe transport
MRPLPKCISAALSFALTPFAVQAQEAAAPDGTKLPEVLVTAERVETTLHKTPVSVVPIGAEELSRRGVAQLADLVGVVAGITVPNGFSNMPQAVGIRGVGVSNAAMSQAVGIYVDDVPSSGATPPRFGTCPTSNASKCCEGRKARCTARTAPPVP